MIEDFGQESEGKSFVFGEENGGEKIRDLEKKTTISF